MSEPQFYPPRQGYPPPGYPPQPRYPPSAYPPHQGPPPGYPPHQGPPPGYPPQQGPPGYPPQQGSPGNRPQQQNLQPPNPPHQFGPAGETVIPIVGTGAAKIAARLGRVATVNGQGFSLSSNKHAGWQVEWYELRRVTITRAYHQAVGRISRPVWRIRLVMDAIDPTFAQRHPDLAHGEGKHGGTGPGSFGVPLGPVPNRVDQLAQALGYFGGGVFAGVIDEGQLLGFGYL